MRALAVVRGAVLPLAAGLLAFVFRVAASTDLTNDHYLSLVLSQQMLFGELPGRDFVDPGMPLAILLSAFPQVVSPGTFAEVVFCSLMLGLAAAATFAAADRISGSMLVALAATAFEVGLQPRLYSYPKILVPAVAVWLIVRYTETPTRGRLIAVGVWTVAGALLRHDLGLYVAAGALVAIVVRGWGQWKALAMDLGVFVLTGAAAAAPYLGYVAWAEGLREHARRGLEFTKSEVFERIDDWPGFPWITQGGAWSSDDAASLLYYAVYLTGLAALLGVLLRRRTRALPHVAAVAAVLTILAGFLAVVLRHPISARIPDLAAALALAWACAAGDPVWALYRQKGRARLTALGGLLATVVSALAIGGSIWVFAGVDEDLDNGGFYAGRRGAQESMADARDRGTVWPWTRAWPSRDLPAVIRYLNACLAPDDALTLTWRAPEYNFFARRRFSAGHVEFLAPSAFTTEQDQAQMLAWLGEDRVPIVLINETLREEFADAYPRVDGWLRTHYAAVDTFEIYDGSTITIAADRRLTARSVWGEKNWPCHFAGAGR